MAATIYKSSSIYILYVLVVILLFPYYSRLEATGRATSFSYIYVQQSTPCLLRLWRFYTPLESACWGYDKGGGSRKGVATVLDSRLGLVGF